jgi:hypothetical protein
MLSKPNKLRLDYLWMHHPNLQPRTMWIMLVSIDIEDEASILKKEASTAS